MSLLSATIKRHGLERNGSFRVGAKTKDADMIFALATLAFLAAAWLAVVVLAATLEDYGPKVLAALSGRQPARLPSMTIRMRPRYAVARPVRMQPRPVLRAAA
jgi:hypothetical protein